MATCFVVQGFGKKTDYTDGRVLDLDASYAVIREAVVDAGLQCIRADELVHSGTIDQPMYEQLLRADLVIADLSTYNVNAIFELGVRYGLRPHATIILAEEGFKPVFDVSHIVIRRYRHLGEDIGAKEALRLKAALQDAIAQILAGAAVDSPVYTFLHRLQPPCDAPAAALAAAAAAAPLPPAPGDDAVTCKWLLETALAKLAPRNGAPADFTGARELLELLHEKRPQDHHVLHQLALATYKAQQPSPRDALLAARELLRALAPETTNDPETLGLWGAVHKRLWEQDADPEMLSASIEAYGRGFYLKQDAYNGINYALLLERRALGAAVSGARDEAIADQVGARRVRELVLRYAMPRLADLDELAAASRYWMLATLWEAALGLDRVAEAAEWERRARAVEPADWLLQSTEEQLVRMRETQARLALALAAKEPST
jgi:hypothetical protein